MNKEKQETKYSEIPGSIGFPILSNYPVEELFNADPNCNHEVVALWSGVKCSKCSGWFCY